MSDWESTELPDELGDVAARLRHSRHEATPLELDDLKRRALARAAAAERAPRRGLRGRLVTVLLVTGLSASAASAGVIAGTSASKQSPSASLSQYESAVLPATESSIPSSARLSAPSGCRRRSFYVRVTGRNIQKIVFTLDGRKIRTVNVRGTSQATRTFRVKIIPRKIKVGAHRVTARITWKAAARKRPRTLRVSVFRCAERAIAPRFTG